MQKKFRSQRGLTLTETLTALAVFAILSVVLLQGVNAAWKVYRKAVTAGEARTLQSTLTQALSNELRYAHNVRVAGGAVVFDSDTFGMGAQVVEEDGRLIIRNADSKEYALLGEKAYTSGLRAQADISYSAGLFTIKLTVKQAQLLPDGLKTELTVQALNENTP